MLMHIASGFNIFGIHISFYGIMMALAFVCAIWVATYNAKKRGFKTEDIFTLALYIIPFSILGARTYFCIFTETPHTFWQFFEIWNGGLAILGGVIGGVIAILLYSKIHKKNLLEILSIAAPSLILGQAIGRIGCFFAGCCYGVEVLNPALHFFPISIEIDGVWHYATMFWESFLCVVGFIILQTLLNKNAPKGTTVCAYLCYYGTIRAIIETFRGDSLYLFGSGIKVSQALSIVLIILGIIGFILIHTKKKKNETIKNS